MKTILLTAAAMLTLTTGLSFAAVGPAYDVTPTIEVQKDGTVQLARRGRGGDDSGGDDNGGDRGGRGRGADDGPGDDRGGNDDRANSGGGTVIQGLSGSGRRKPRIPGGSGCDDAGDVAEHPECSPNQ